MSALLLSILLAFGINPQDCAQGHIITFEDSSYKIVESDTEAVCYIDNQVNDHIRFYTVSMDGSSATLGYFFYSDGPFPESVVQWSYTVSLADLLQ